MTVALVILAAACAVCAGSAAWALVRCRTRHAPPLKGRTVVLHTRRPDDQTLRGVLVAEHSDRWTLRDVVYVHPSGESQVGGIVHVLVVNVAWCQEIEA